MVSNLSKSMDSKHPPSEQPDHRPLTPLNIREEREIRTDGSAYISSNDSIDSLPHEQQVSLIKSSRSQNIGTAFESAGKRRSRIGLDLWAAVGLVASIV